MASLIQRLGTFYVRSLPVAVPVGAVGGAVSCARDWMQVSDPGLLDTSMAALLGGLMGTTAALAYPFVLPTVAVASLCLRRSPVR